MKKLTLLVAGLLFAGVTFAAPCDKDKTAKACCKKGKTEAKACCKKDATAKKEAKKEETTAKK